MNSILLNLKHHPKFAVGGMIVLLIVLVGITLSPTQETGNSIQIQIFDDVEMVLVPSGCFLMGSDDAQIKQLGEEEPNLATYFENQAPQTRICFNEPLWADKYLVTNEQFNRLGGDAEEESYWDDDNRPREMITWDEAREFCELRGAHLPTEAEWEYIARGADNLLYPWGNEWNPDNAVWSLYTGSEYPNNLSRQTADVGSKPNGASWIGALDLAGNVSEWTSSLYQPYPYNKEDGRENTNSREPRTLRGGSWAYHSFYFQTAYRGFTAPSDRSNEIGFRCVRSFDT